MDRIHALAQQRCVIRRTDRRTTTSAVRAGVPPAAVGRIKAAHAKCVQRESVGCRVPPAELHLALSLPSSSGLKNDFGMGGTVLYWEGSSFDAMFM